MPDWQEYVRAHLPALRVDAARERSIADELALQLEQAYQDALSSGHSEREAVRIAEDQLLDWDRLAAEIDRSQPERYRPSARFWSGIPSDLRHAFRVLRKSPVFSLVAIATLAIGIGGCTAIFSLLDAVLLKPIDYHRPDELVMVWEKKNSPQNVVAMADYLDWRTRNHVFSDMSPVLDQIWNVSGHGDPVVLKGIAVNERFLPMLGTQPLLGRSFSAEEMQPGNPGVVMLSHKVWVEMFGARRDALGATILLDDRPWTVIGILPANFPWLGKPLDVLTPTHFANRDWRVKAGRFLRVVSRLKPGVPITQAQKEMSAIARQLEREYPAFNKGWGVNLVPMSDQFASGAGSALWILMGAVGVVLLIACSNVANLMLARAVVREREMALRTALGASRFQLIRLLIMESLVLAIMGGALGCAGATAVVRLVQLYGPRDIARLQTAELNMPVVLFALAVSFVTGCLFGAAPALAAGRLNLSGALKEGGRTALNTIRGERLRNTFVVAEIALALVLLTGASLLVESLYRLSHVSPGFDPSNVLTANISVSGNVSDQRLGEMCRQIVDRLRALPGVENAGFITFLPFAGQDAATGFSVVGRPPYGPGQDPVTDVHTVQPGYFETMRIPLVHGRVFTNADNRAGAPRRFVVNEALVRQMFNGEEPLGHSLVVQMGDDKPGEIVGVVANTKHMSLDGAPLPTVYYVQAHLPISFGSFVMRTKLRPELMTSAMTAAIREIKKDQPVSDIRSMESRIGESVSRMSFQTALLSSFAGIAVVLALIGVYGVMAYAVEQRTHEIGVRLALGAEPGQVRRWMTMRGVQLAGIGLSLGLVAAAASTRVLSTLLYGVRPGDPLTFAVAAVLLAIACVLASYVPARRATAVDPASALRAE